jgi:hypothetical protein
MIRYAMLAYYSTQDTSTDRSLKNDSLFVLLKNKP